MHDAAEPCRPLRRQAYALLIAVAAAAATGRILSTSRLVDPQGFRPPGAARDDPRAPWPKQTPGVWPTFGSNDRSRFAAVRALVDEGTWVIGRRDRKVVLASVPAPLSAAGPLELVTVLAAARQARIDSDRGIVTQDGWSTVDKVLQPTTLEFYSTKPPLLTLVAAGEYWLLKKSLGWSIVKDSASVVRTIVWTLNIPLLVAYLITLAVLLERWGTTDWGRLFIAVAACFGTLVTPFLVTFNNHTMATCTGLLAVALVVRILAPRDKPPGWGTFMLAGFLAGFTVCAELPAAALAVGLFAVLLLRRPGPSLAAFVPAALLPVAVLLMANHAELGQWLPAYGEFGGPWYEYEGSNWQVVPGHVGRGIDNAPWLGETKAGYAFHLLLGHHGWFSLTPINFLGLAGMILGLRSWMRSSRDGAPVAEPARVPPQPLRGFGHNSATRLWAELAVGSLLISAVVIGFYIIKTHNYGGVSAGPRWLMWLTPLWLLAMMPVADRLARHRVGRVLAIVLLILSVLSASYPSWNPWRHPWIFDWMEANGLLPY